MKVKSKRELVSVDENYLKEIKAINWFSSCGKKSADGDHLHISSWNEAEEFLLTPEWEATTLEAGNNLSSFLNKNHHAEFQLWNKYAEKARIIFSSEVEPKIRSIQEKVGVSDVLIDCVNWDVTHAIIEHEFVLAGCENIPLFFNKLITIYIAGHFPCGWVEGEWPTGKLAVY